MTKLLAIFLSLQLIMAPLAFAGKDEGAGAGDQYRQGPAEAGAGDYVNQLLGISNSIVGATVITRCGAFSMQPSLILYLAGGIAYVAKEVLGGGGQGSFHKAKQENLKMVQEKMVQGGDLQKASLEAALGDEKKNLNMIKQRRSWMMAIKVIYTAAAALAIIEAILAVTPPVYKTDIGMCVPNMAATGITASIIVAAYSIAQSIASGSSAAMALGTAATLAFAQFVLKLTIFSQVADKMAVILNMAVGRISWFTASAAVAIMIDSGLAKREEIAEENIQMITKVLNQFNNQTQPTNSLAEGSSQPPSTEGTAGKINVSTSGNLSSANNYYEKPEFEQTGLPKHCMAQTNNSLDYSPKACSSPLKLVKPQFDINMVDPSIVEASNSGVAFAQAIADGNIEQANVEAGNLNAMAARVTAAKDNILKEANERLKANGMNPLDPDGMSKKHIAEIVNNVQQEIQKRGEPNPLSLNMNPLEETTQTDKDAKDKKLADNNIKAKEIHFSSPSNEKPKEDLTLTEGNLTEGNLSLLDAANPGVLVATTLEEGLSDYNFEETQNDVSVQKDASIFSLISNRYKKSYSRVMNKKALIEVQP